MSSSCTLRDFRGNKKNFLSVSFPITPHSRLSLMEIDGKVLETVGGKDSSRLSLKEIDGKVQSPL